MRSLGGGLGLHCCNFNIVCCPRTTECALQLQWDGEWVISFEQWSKGPVLLIGVVVCLLPAPQIQLFADMASGFSRIALQYRWLVAWCYSGSMPNWWLRGPRFYSSPVHCQVTTLGKLFTHTCLCSPNSIVWYRAITLVMVSHLNQSTSTDTPWRSPISSSTWAALLTPPDTPTLTFFDESALHHQWWASCTEFGAKGR